MSELWIGEGIEATSGNRDGTALRLGREALTTHAVLVGMTGSGKTGLGVVIIEEVLRSGVPVLILDPKGDMGNLALTFPDGTADDFAPWVDPGEAARRGVDAATLAADAAAAHAKGLASWGLAGADVAALRAAADVTLYTPGSSAGLPLSVLGSLQAPPRPFDEAAEDLRAEIESFVSSLLLLAGIESDPVSSREHILLAHLIERAWRAGRDLSLAELIAEVAQPPLRQIGVFELDRFFPERERDKLAMRLNGLVASPSFQAWLQGQPLDIERMLYTPEGKPRCAVVYLPHLADEQRMFAVTLLLSKVVSWMRRQSGTSDLRALVYMDEVFGFCPPTAAPPSKQPILTLLKQARAHGVGVVLATQNPVDLDYKAMSNAGTWLVGRLSTERDKARIVEALRSAAGDVDTAALDRVIGGLGKRHFVLLGARNPRPTLFTSRYALSYLRGPFTRDEVERLRRRGEPAAPAVAAPPESLPSATPTPMPMPSPTPSPTPMPTALAKPAPTAAIAPQPRPLGPTVAPGVRIASPRAGSPVAILLDARDGAATLRAAVGFRLRLHLRVPGRLEPVAQRWEAVWRAPEDRLDARALQRVDLDDGVLAPARDVGVTWQVPQAPIAASAWWREICAALVAHIAATHRVPLYVHPELGKVSDLGESEASFRRRLRVITEASAEGEARAMAQRWADHASAQRQRIAQAAYGADSRRAEAVAALQRAEKAAAQAALLGRADADADADALAAARDTVAECEAQQRKLDAARAEIDAFEARLGDKIAAVHEAALARADATQAIEVGVAPDGIEVEPLLLWVPVIGPPV